MLHYITLGSNDIQRSKKFYDAALKPLGIVRMVTAENEIAYGEAKQKGTEFKRLWVVTPHLNYPANWGNGTMIALTASSRAAVKAFHAAAIKAGGSDDGKPAVRYRPNFYACYVRDPDGNKLSAVFEN